jgi:NitT/TauT family transport system ATP-binding protein/sulfonate transport system ATP-binding protein
VESGVTKLAIENVSRTFAGTRGGQPVKALQPTDLAVNANDFITILGPSGCGKSTLLRIVAGLDTPSTGCVLLDGREVRRPGPDRGMVFQSYTLFPWLTVRNNVEYGLKRKGTAPAERNRIVDHYLGEIGLAAFAHHYPKQLSGGMMQRVAIARALANDPDILLMDEPFGALDSQTRHSMQRLLLRVWEHSQKTVAFVTHDIDEGILLGDRVIVMTARPGKVKADIRIDIPRPRDPEIVLEPEFIAIKRRIINELRDEIDDTH